MHEIQQRAVNKIDALGSITLSHSERSLIQGLKARAASLENQLDNPTVYTEAVVHTDLVESLALLFRIAQLNNVDLIGIFDKWLDAPDQTR